MQEIQTRDRIKKAYNKLLKNDLFLLENNVNERSITHKLAEYLQLEFSDYNVDCEYNRNGLEVKRLESFKKNISSDNINGDSVFPDIIIHHRGTNDNFIVIEAKKTSNSNDSDLTKLKAYKKDLKYKYAYFISFPVLSVLGKYKNGDLNELIENI